MKIQAFNYNFSFPRNAYILLFLGETTYKI